MQVPAPTVFKLGNSQSGSDLPCDTYAQRTLSLNRLVPGGYIYIYMSPDLVIPISFPKKATWKKLFWANCVSLFNPPSLLN